LKKERLGEGSSDRVPYTKYFSLHQDGWNNFIPHNQLFIPCVFHNNVSKPAITHV